MYSYGSRAKDFISVHVLAKVFQKCRAKLLEVACNYLVFKLNGLFTCIKFSFGGDI